MQDLLPTNFEAVLGPVLLCSCDLQDFHKIALNHTLANKNRGRSHWGEFATLPKATAKDIFFNYMFTEALLPITVFTAHMIECINSLHRFCMLSCTFMPQ